jgi:hypothetical protein
MAKVIITLTDDANNQQASLDATFQHTFNADNPTTAEYIAMQFIMQCVDEAAKARS